ncbi:hypothetical protein WJM97_21940 [Okeanomitos corallinicola TIOX110]|uniref:Uncharacterized protein n=1 Tax=Okeanomitos corallinicola TIOX110 TaxID=3133117 RepID=A0ABZ2URH0_9CYAN
MEAAKIYVIDGKFAIELKAFAKIINYSPTALLDIVRRLLSKRIRIGIKWKKKWYILLPDMRRFLQLLDGKEVPDQIITTPSNHDIDLEKNWVEVVKRYPALLPKRDNEELARPRYNLPPVSPNPATGQLFMVQSSTLNSKTDLLITNVKNNNYRATTAYSYGYQISYDPKLMSTFDPGTAGSLNSTQLPQAFFEVCRALDAAENLRNGANPGVAPRNNISTTVSFDTGTIAVAATLPVVVSVGGDGSATISISDYLTGYSTFDGGGGDLKSTHLAAALYEISNILANAEKAVTPATDQPNNIQIVVDKEAGNAQVNANIPFTTSAAANGDVVISAIDYL